MNTLVICILRSLFFFGLAGSLNELFDTGVSPYIVGGASLVGVALATWLSSTRITFYGFVGLVAGCLTIHQIGFWAVQTYLPDITSEVFVVYIAQEQSFIALIALLVSALSTWFFFRVPGVATVELIGLLALFISLLSAHRDFNLSFPKYFNSVAWSFGVNPLVVFVAAGLFGAVLTTYYAFLSARSDLTAAKFTEEKASPSTLIAKSLSIILIALVFGFIGRNYFLKTDAFLTASGGISGVGQDRSPGMSPLGFHSALGGTAQPSALVRLDDDYKENPFTPMLYLRENALSQYNGREMVMADRVFDHDITNSAPEEAYTTELNPLLEQRPQVSLSAYLLAKHNTAFAVDYPISVTPLKNPNPQRFVGAFKAVSLVPRYTLDDLNFSQVGEPSWSKDVWNHYIQTNQDPRYKELAQKIAGAEISPALQAAAIAKYLSANAIYTLKPNHTVSPDQDPVSPFLFGDMRGYCVHFAHASVFMLRSLGIPARIGTGYLTDLSQAKDGHILLRMSDRHAWAEVYIQGKGWVPFDTKPERVESHAETQVDMKLLEELMGMLGPDELILPKDIAAGERGLTEHEDLPALKLPNLIPYMVAMLVLSFLVKLYVRFGWLIPGSGAVKRGYRAFASFYYDLGFTRHVGETRNEYKDRIKTLLSVDALILTEAYIESRYDNKGTHRYNSSEVRALCIRERASIKKLGILYRIVSFLNPSSLLTYLGGRW